MSYKQSIATPFHGAVFPYKSLQAPRNRWTAVRCPTAANSASRRPDDVQAGDDRRRVDGGDDAHDPHQREPVGAPEQAAVLPPMPTA